MMSVLQAGENRHPCHCSLKTAIHQGAVLVINHFISNGLVPPSRHHGAALGTFHTTALQDLLDVNPRGW